MKTTLPCAIYTRKSSEEGLEQEFNSLHAQREACQAYIQSQKGEGWKAIPTQYDDGGYSGGTLARPALQTLLQDIASGKVKVIVVYKVDRLTRSLADFAKLVEQFDAQGVSFVSVTQQFNTTTSMGRLTLNVLLSFAQFEREVTGERIRDKIAASKQKGLWMGGSLPTGYLAKERTLVIDELQAERVRQMFSIYLDKRCVRALKTELDRRGWTSPQRISKTGNTSGDRPFGRGQLYRLLSNPVYLGEIRHKGKRYRGQHPAIIDQATWDQAQAILASNRRGKRLRKGALAPSLLAGKVFDEQGQRLTPTHTHKGTRRYRYYVSEALLGKARKTDQPDGLRIPAHELEAIVLKRLTEHLSDPKQIQRDHGHMEAREVMQVEARAEQLLDRLRQNNSHDTIEVLDELLDRVIVSATSLTVTLKSNLFDPSRHQEMDGPVCLTQPVQFRRSGFGIRLVIPGEQAPSSPRRDERLIRLIQRGQTWFQRLAMEGMSPSRIAEAEKVSPSLVQRILYTAFLAPDIVQTIEEGKQPIHLTSDTLLKHLPLPMDWSAQRELLGVNVK